MEHEKLITEQEAADWLSLEVDTLRRMRREDKVPYYTVPSGRPRYKLSELNSFCGNGCPLTEAGCRGVIE